MLALDDYEKSLCPNCGLPLAECHDPRAQFDFDAQASVCWVSAKRQIALAQWREDHASDPTDWSPSLTMRVTERAQQPAIPEPRGD